MTPARQQALLKAQTGVARKVYDVVPIQSPWSPLQIKGALTASGHSSAELSVIRACLNDLKDAGLVREVDRQMFLRTEVRTPPQQKDQPMPRIVTSIKPAAKAGNTSASPIELLGDLASQLKTLGEEFSAKVQALAARVEEAALTIEQGLEANAANLEKVRQLQTLLKSLAEPNT
ncbi:MULTISPECIES: hypothetical protein [unclassified Pseudomonas]|uniref:hypothetical protein n=1 Tax=unclassified Pseudomonas TaxID=196821 RepID=UPI00073029BB|nr:MULTISPECIES: hypothetical protein [unclassified Pseudomonas]KSW22806.1 hypothetical protein AOX63_05155 [Pseudomonas sp. ADP]KSW28424.1 hypothetical protein AOX63_00015 [Pseudomonas sp. ADP]OBP13094.1 hypothetical protein BAE52_01055 [Pseudomonas sp. EGD-AKN5]QOF85737.1 hypothetical protein IG194_03275 [Pseudomonas sp. ADPe]